MKQETEDKVSKLAGFQQALNKLHTEKYSYQNELLELDSASEELDNSNNSYKIIGNLMVAMPKKAIKSEIQLRKDYLKDKIKSIESQEKRITKDASDLQSQVLSELEESENGSKSSN